MLHNHQHYYVFSAVQRALSQLYCEIKLLKLYYHEQATFTMGSRKNLALGWEIVRQFTTFRFKLMCIHNARHIPQCVLSTLCTRCRVHFLARLHHALFAGRVMIHDNVKSLSSLHLRQREQKKYV